MKYQGFFLKAGDECMVGSMGAPSVNRPPAQQAKTEPHPNGYKVTKEPKSTGK